MYKKQFFVYSQIFEKFLFLQARFTTWCSHLLFLPSQNFLFSAQFGHLLLDSRRLAQHWACDRVAEVVSMLCRYEIGRTNRNHLGQSQFDQVETGLAQPGIEHLEVLETGSEEHFLKNFHLYNFKFLLKSF